MSFLMGCKLFQFLFNPLFLFVFTFNFYIFFFLSLNAVETPELKALNLFNAGLYEEAEQSYLEALEQPVADPSLLKIKLGQIYLATKQYIKAISILETIDNPLRCYLQAIAYQRLNEDDKALLLFNKYLQTTEKIYRDEVYFEIALIYFREKQYQESLNQLKQIHSSNKRIQDLVEIYRAKICLQENQNQEAITILTSVIKEISPQDLLYFEANALLGQCYFQSYDYTKAIIFLKDAFPQNNPESYGWYSNSLYQLGCSYIYTGQLKKGELELKKLLNQPESINDSGAILLMAQATSVFAEREQLYRQLTIEYPDSGVFWYMRGLNHFEEGFLKNETNVQESHQEFTKSLELFQKAFTLLKKNHPSLAVAAMKYKAIAASISSRELASKILEDLIENDPDLIGSIDHPDEIHYLLGFFSIEQSSSVSEKAFITASKEGNYFGDVALKCLGDMYYTCERYELAEKAYLQLYSQFAKSSLCGDSLFLSALCSDKLQQDFSIGKERRLLVFENFPKSSYAPEAYFTYYTYQEYLQGDRQSIKHLQHFASVFPKTPFLIEAYYLIGLDSKRDRKTIAGKWIKKKNLMEAIDAFQEAETLFDTCEIPKTEVGYYELVRIQAVLERAKANLAIAEESQGAKRQIYLDYAKNVFKHLVDDLKEEQSFLTLQESSYWLAKTYIALQEYTLGKKILSEMIERYYEIKETQNYYLSRAYYELGVILLQEKEYLLSLKALHSANLLNTLLSTDEKLELWIQESLCYTGLMQFDQVILTLSKVINDASVSTLRLKAMWMRAEAYEVFHRPELARKQLESLSRKGGEWASKAKEKLEKNYAY